MKSNNDVYPVIIVGASIAGCTAAILYADAGMRVLVLEKSAFLSDYKKLCTHFVQPCGVPILRKLNLYGDIDHLGLESKAEFWTSAGWLSSKEERYANGECAINLERSKIDPYLKAKISNYPSIELRLNATVQSVEGYSDDGYSKVSYKDENGNVVTLSTNLLVAADGRYSKIAGLINNQHIVYPNDRFVHFAYYKNLPISTQNFSKFWMLGEIMAFIYPLLDEHSLVALYIPHTEKKKWKDDLEGSFNEIVRALPDGPDIDKAERVTPIHGMSNIDSYYRAPYYEHVAFIGDAALSLDPAAGTGCGFALLAASWLVECTVDVIENKDALIEKLNAYSDHFKNCLEPHIKGITADSLVTKDINADKVFYSKLVNNDNLLESFLDLTGRLITPKEFQRTFFKNSIPKKKPEGIEN